MLTKQYQLVPLFEKFIRQSHSGRRLKADGSRIKKQTVGNYDYVLRYLREYEEKYDTLLHIKTTTGNNKRSIKAESVYWKKFYLQFTEFLYRDKDCYDNYVGAVVKILRMFFNFVNKELLIRTGDFYKKFYICSEKDYGINSESSFSFSNESEGINFQTSHQCGEVSFFDLLPYLRHIAAAITFLFN